MTNEVIYEARWKAIKSNYRETYAWGPDLDALARDLDDMGLSRHEFDFYRVEKVEAPK